jgi:hypothetical protein
MVPALLVLLWNHGSSSSGSGYYSEKFYSRLAYVPTRVPALIPVPEADFFLHNILTTNFFKTKSCLFNARSIIVSQKVF